MISVFFRCACPYVGYTLKRADYVNREMLDCKPIDMTRTGHKVLHSSGSYVILGHFEGKKYFHIRQSKSTAKDEQGRQIYTNLALVGDTAEDERIINRIAGYALFDEQSFYSEIANMMILLESDFTVDFDTLKNFLNRFKQDYAVQSSNFEVAALYRHVFFTTTRNEVDIIVTEADWSYFLKQVGINFQKPVYCFNYNEAKTLADSVRLEFKKITEADTDCKSVVLENTLPPDTKESLRTSNSLMSTTINEQLPACPKEQQMLKDKLNAAEVKLVALTSETGKLQNALKKHFFLGLLVGVIGTVITVLILNKVF